MTKDIDYYVFKNNLYFKNDQNLSKIESFSIYNLLGQCIYQSVYKKNIVPLNFLKQGVYIFKVEKKDTKTAIRRFVIQ